MTKYKKLVGDYGRIMAVGGIISMSNRFGMAGQNVVFVYAQAVVNNKADPWRVVDVIRSERVL